MKCHDCDREAVLAEEWTAIVIPRCKEHAWENSNVIAHHRVGSKGWNQLLLAMVKIALSGEEAPNLITAEEWKGPMDAFPSANPEATDSASETPSGQEALATD